MSHNLEPQQATEIIRNKIGSFKPRVGIVLGSGLSELADNLTESITIPYETLPGFPRIHVKGHRGNLILGYLAGTPVACLQGRSHFYEQTSYQAVLTYVRTLKLLGCEYFLATNASGSLNEEMTPGSLMLVNDHINFQPGNPLAGINDDAFGPRFPSLDKAYSQTMAENLKASAQKLNIPLYEGIYISVLGPSYETAAEIRMFKSFGADAVGMSTVPEVIVANHCGLKVAVIASITNFATGLKGSVHSHDKVVEMAQYSAKNLQKLVKDFIATIK